MGKGGFVILWLLKIYTISKIDCIFKFASFLKKRWTVEKYWIYNKYTGGNNIWCRS